LELPLKDYDTTQVILFDDIQNPLLGSFAEGETNINEKKIEMPLFNYRFLIIRLKDTSKEIFHKKLHLGMPKGYFLLGL